MYITINSEFKPFTYDELTKPLRDYTEAYNKVEEQYATLAQQTEAWKNIATQENSPEAYAMYKKYSDELNAVVEDFSRGMTIQNRGKLTGLKTRYSSEITPIANAYNAMQEANKYRETVRAKDGSAVFVKDRYNSLDDFLHGNQADNTFISGDEVQKNITARVLAQSYTDYNNLINSGISSNKAAQIVASGTNQSIADIIADEKASLGIEAFDAQGQAKLNNAILAGVQQGLGSFASKEYMSKAERDASARSWAGLAETRRQHDISLIRQGYNLDGSVNPDSPYWVLQGVKWNKGEDGTLTAESAKKEEPKTKRDYIVTEARAFDLDGKITEHGDTVDLTGSTNVTYFELNDEEKKIADKQIGEADISLFEFYVIRDHFRDSKKRVIIVPKKTIVTDNDSSGDNDL